jgi:hypothetical protein
LLTDGELVPLLELTSHQPAQWRLVGLRVSREVLRNAEIATRFGAQSASGARHDSDETSHSSSQTVRVGLRRLSNATSAEPWPVSLAAGYRFLATA